MRRIGVLMGFSGDDAASKARLAAFRQGLKELDWIEGRNVLIDERFGRGDDSLARKYAVELVALKPDVLLAQGSGTMGVLQQTAGAIPIVFAEVIDPVAGGFVESIARPGGNATGFTNFEYSLAGKWLELLKKIAPSVTRAAVLRDPDRFANGGQMGAIQALAPSLGVEIIPADIRDPTATERSITSFARGMNGGLVVLATFKTYTQREAIVALAARYQLPAVYPERFFVASGGLISYGPNNVEQYARAAGYVDRILKNARPAELPVQAPNKYRLTVNALTAKALGLTIPETLLATADEVIQ